MQIIYNNTLKKTRAEELDRQNEEKNNNLS